MSFITFILAIFGAAFLINLVFIGQAFAYIDMGTGSLLFQFIVGGVIGFFFTVKMYWPSLVRSASRRSLS